jgi:alpha-L-fucosidase
MYNSAGLRKYGDIGGERAMRAKFVVAFCVIVGAGVAGAYDPNWESLDMRSMPAWFNEAKFGVFVVWGVYSVPAWSEKGAYAEWYGHDMNDPGKATYAFHRKTYGESFRYEDFAPRFTAELFEPGAWADLFKRAGARYVVFSAKFHDGFCMWPTPTSPGWNSVEVGPKRDIAGELTEAVRRAGLRMGFYYSLYEWNHPLYKTDLERYVAEHMTPQLRDLTTRYVPDILWTDGEWDHDSGEWKSAEFLSWLFNESPSKRDIVVNDRWGKDCRGKHGGFYTFEYGGCTGSTKDVLHAWEEDRGMGASYGYNRNESIEDYSSAEQLIRLLVDTASQGGNLLLDVGPEADGSIPVIMQERLLQIGRWLNANGESIYGTQRGPIGKSSWGGCTQKANTVYFHVFDWPQGGRFDIPDFKRTVRKAYILADPEKIPLNVERKGEGVSISLPSCAPDAIASVVACETDGATASTAL